MKKNLLKSGIAIILFSLPIMTFGQVPDLGTAGCFALYTVTGAVSNTGISTITGDVGTNTGAITGFGTVHGAIHNTDSHTAQSSIDLLKAYAQLNAMIPTSPHIPVLGNGETLYAGVYYIAAAGSALTDLYLDGQGDSSALFIFQIGGAFTTGASTVVHLINGAQVSNVFWKVEGAISMAAGTEMKGTMIANNGAIGMGDGGLMDGRMLSTTGAISVYGVQSSNTIGCTPMPGESLPVELTSISVECLKTKTLLRWSTASEINNSYFTVESSADAIAWEKKDIVRGAGNSNTTLNYSYTDPSHYEESGHRYYRLKQTDFDGQFKYSPIQSADNCGSVNTTIRVYPNPSDGKFTLTLKGGSDEVFSTDIYNMMSERVDGSIGFQSTFDLSAMMPGVYFIQVHQSSKTVMQKIVVQK
ncbi:MAG: hypothetical protein JWO03_2894 [Bacteroidetes bacterium]|nr:hypothetical protein [Bacteroidota bacterium]